jgi:trimethylguanosine synthase
MQQKRSVCDARQRIVPPDTSSTTAAGTWNASSSFEVDCERLMSPSRDWPGPTSDKVVEPLSEDLNKHWLRRYEYFTRFDEGIQIDAEGLYSVVPEQTALEQAKLVKGGSVLDAFTGVGGNAIGFARYGKHVIAADHNERRLSMAVNNARVYGVDDSIEFHLCDALISLQEFQADAVYLDPPWGGLNYKDRGVFRLSDFQPSGHTLLRVAFRRFREILLRVPRTFSLEECDQLDREFSVHDDLSNGRLISRTVYFQSSNP